MRRTGPGVLAVGVLAVLLGACRPVWPPIRDWLQCDECSEGELEAVVAVGKHAVGPLAIALRDGPSARQIGNVRARAISDFEAARRFRDRHAANPDVAGVPLDADAFTTRYVTAYIDLFRERGLQGLSAIGSPAARDSIHQLRLRDAAAPFGWSPSIRASVLRHDEGLTQLRITGPDAIGIGQTLPAQVEAQGPLQNPQLVWSSSDNARLTVSASGGQLTGLAPGLVVIRVCWVPAGFPDAGLCASRPIQVTP